MCKPNLNGKMRNEYKVCFALVESKLFVDTEKTIKYSIAIQLVDEWQYMGGYHFQLSNYLH
jgi:hypothetical protein